MRQAGSPEVLATWPFPPALGPCSFRAHCPPGLWVDDPALRTSVVSIPGVVVNGSQEK